jgi:hypothetical protein
VHPVRFKIILSPTSTSSNLPLSKGFPYQNPVSCRCLFHCTCIANSSLSTILHYTNKSMEQRLSGKAKRSSASRKIPRILWNPNVHYRIHNSQLPALSGARSIQPTPPSHFSEIHFNIILPSRPGSSKWSHSLRFSHHNPICTSPLPICATCPAHLSYLFDQQNDIWWGIQNTKPRVI